MCSFPLVVDVWQIAFAFHRSTVVFGELGARRELVIYLLTNHNIAFSYVRLNPVAKPDKPRRVIGESEDSAQMEVCSSGGRGFKVLPSVVDRVALKQYGLRVIARVEECGSHFYAITADRRMKHPAALAITEHAYSEIFA